jgi:hypothetical protein
MDYDKSKHIRHILLQVQITQKKCKRHRQTAKGTENLKFYSKETAYKMILLYVQAFGKKLKQTTKA